jgi:hypothetical protein
MSLARDLRQIGGREGEGHGLAAAYTGLLGWDLNSKFFYINSCEFKD